VSSGVRPSAPRRFDGCPQILRHVAPLREDAPQKHAQALAVAATVIAFAVGVGEGPEERALLLGRSEWARTERAPLNRCRPNPPVSGEYWSSAEAAADLVISNLVGVLQI
jgi:hypothetical protein